MKSKKPRQLKHEDRELMKALGQRIAQLRRQTGWTPANSKVAGFRHYGIEELEKGTGNPRLTTILDLCKELGITVSDLFKDLM